VGGTANKSQILSEVNWLIASTAAKNPSVDREWVVSHLQDGLTCYFAYLEFPAVISTHKGALFPVHDPV
jgi:hypothetical protein